MSEKEFTKHLKENQERLIIFGTGEQGVRMAKSLLMNEITPLCFCDNNADKIGMQIENIEVCSVADIQVKCQSQSMIFLVSPRMIAYQEEMIAQIKIAYPDHLEYYTLAEFYKNIEKAYFQNVFEKRDWIHFKYAEHTTTDTAYMYADKLTLAITHKCSLRCKDCGQFVPYYEAPRNYDTPTMKLYMDHIDALFDTVSQFGLVGGEPLVHPDFFELLYYAQNKKSFETIIIFTNCTILPTEEELRGVDKTKVIFWLSNYGALSHKINEFAMVLEKMGISFMYSPKETWVDATNIQYRDKTEAELEQTYKDCLHVCPQLVDGKVFPCSHISAAGYLLNALPEDARDHVNFMDPTKSKEEIQKELRYFLHGMKFTKGCNWCVGHTKAEEVQIPPAIQTSEKLCFEKTYPKEEA